MKLAPLILGGSLVANAALVGYIFHLRGSSGAAANAPSAAVASPRSAPTAAGTAQLQVALVSGDVAAMEAAGFSPDVIRAIRIGRAFDKFQAATRALRPKPRDEKFWQRGNRDSGRMAIEARVEQRKAQRELSEAMSDAYGNDLESIFSDRDGQLSFLSAAKRDQLSRIERDYQDMEAQIYAEQEGIQLPSDRDKLKLLRAEKERDILAMLTPEEREQYELHLSNTANTVRARYGDAIATEEQYRKIVALKKALDDEWKPKLESFQGSRTPPEVMRAYNEAQDKVAEAIKAAVSPDDWARAQQANDQDYRALSSLTQRLNLPAPAAPAVIAARDSYAAQSAAINADASLTPAQRRSQLQDLAKQAQNALQSTLTSEGAEAYAQRAQWINLLKNGQAFSTNPKDATRPRFGVGSSVHPLPPPKGTPPPSPDS